jgi:hypothetical protein
VIALLCALLAQNPAAPAQAAEMAKPLVPISADEARTVE